MKRKTPTDGFRGRRPLFIELGPVRADRCEKRRCFARALIPGDQSPGYRRDRIRNPRVFRRDATSVSAVRNCFAAHRLGAEV